MCFGMYRHYSNTYQTHFESQSGYPFDLDIQKSKRAVWSTRGEFRCCHQRFPSFEANSSQIQSRVVQEVVGRDKPANFENWEGYIP